MGPGELPGGLLKQLWAEVSAVVEEAVLEEGVLEGVIREGCRGGLPRQVFIVGDEDPVELSVVEGFYRRRGNLAEKPVGERLASRLLGVMTAASRSLARDIAQSITAAQYRL